MEFFYILIYLFFLSYNNDRFLMFLNFIIKLNYYSNRLVVLLIFLMFFCGFYIVLLFIVNFVKFVIFCFLLELLRVIRWVKYFKIVFFLDGLVSVFKLFLKVYILRCNFKEYIVFCKLFLWFLKRLNIG